MNKILTIQDIRNIFKGAAQNLEINRDLIDTLNVFPVPDGDTGTNMNLTMVSTIKELDSVESEEISDVCQAFARGALKGARGNSGVILSQIFKGMGEVLAESKTITTKAFAMALMKGSNVAYDVVTHPKEGTILTVIRLTSDYAVRTASKKTDFIKFFELILTRCRKVLNDTPNLLPVLKKAGVVDSGGMGLLVILTGMYNVLAGVPMDQPEMASAPIIDPQTTLIMPDVHNLDDIEFAYCTEFFIINLHKRTTISDIDKLRDRLNDIGDSLIVVGDLDLVKIHVHTNQPNMALKYALRLGELDKIKIENMLEQSRAIKKETKVIAKKDKGMVAICVGDGLNNIFKELNVDATLEGGQTMNPSVADIIQIVDSINAENVFILPNNSNIILAAEQAKELTKTNLVVIATKNIPQGISAAINFDPEASVEDNVYSMQQAASSVKSGQITHAVRDTEMDGFELKNGDIIGIYNGIKAKGSEVDEVATDLIAGMVDDNCAAITLYYGCDVKEEEAEVLVAKLQEVHPFFDINVYRGGQAHYFYFVAVE
ncbi:MAG: DAK2 domain-containing protein [Bacillota bacterium]